MRLAELQNRPKPIEAVHYSVDQIAMHCAMIDMFLDGVPLTEIADVFEMSTLDARKIFRAHGMAVSANGRRLKALAG